MHKIKFTAKSKSTNTSLSSRLRSYPHSCKSPTRVDFFYKSLKDLEASATNGTNPQQMFLQVKNVSQVILSKIESEKSLFDIELFVSQDNLKSKQIDDISKRYLPHDMHDLTPLSVQGDGNCLYRAASLFVCGDESMHIELRVRTVIEMALNAEYYCQPEVTSFLGGYASSEDIPKISAPRLHATSQNFTRADDHPIIGNIVMDTFIYDVLSSTKNGCWSTMWHLYALASALRSTVQSIYPECNSYIRPLYHKMIKPREPAVLITQPLLIMWTNTVYKDTAKSWSPNHFVACIHTTQTSPLNKVKGTAPINTITSTKSKIQPTKAIPSRNFEIVSSRSTKTTPITKTTTISTQPRNSKNARTNVITILSKKCNVPMLSVTTPKPIPTTADILASKLKCTARKKPVKNFFKSLNSTTQKVKTDAATHLRVRTQKGCAVSINKTVNRSPTDSLSTLEPESIQHLEPEPLLILEPEPQHVLEPEPLHVLEPEPLHVLEPEFSPTLDTKHSIPSASEILVCMEKRKTHKQQKKNFENSIASYFPISSSVSLSDESEDSESGSFSERMDSSTCNMVECETGDLLSANQQFLPFPNMQYKWYSEQQQYYEMNIQRNELRKNEPVHKSNTETDELLYLDRSQASGTIEENLERLRSLENKNSKYSALIRVGKYILENGPLIKTQDVGKVYDSIKQTKGRRSAEYYELFAKYFNLVQLYIYGVAYLFPKPSLFDPAMFIQQIKHCIDKKEIVRNTITSKLSKLFPESLKYADTHRDRQIIKGLLAELTSVKFTAKLQGIQSRQGTQSAKKALHSGLNKYHELVTTSQVVRNDLTCQQQYLLTQRIISKRKVKEIKTIAKGRGRKLKSDKFPVALALEFAFGEMNLQRGGGGLESHPRLITGTLYKSIDNATSMREAREILLCLAPPSFTISLSSCYNYTENYREGSRQAKCHHAGRGINANISLKKPSRTGVEQLVVNLHWSTANVNNIIDTRKCRTAVISKDAKASISADCSPVQNPGKSWKKLELPDHTFDQSRTNQITPMTFLCLDTSSSLDPVTIDGESVRLVTRTGQGVTFLYLSFFEPDTTVKCLNEILYLLSLTGLRQFFKGETEDNIKKEIIFVVDNGPQEKPSNAIVQMCLVRLLNFLQLDKITQVSFAEYHSKRNFVERVHAQENLVLSAHGAFDGHSVHKSPSVGSKEHHENMEKMADEVQKCIAKASFGKSKLICCRGLRKSDFIFDDEEQLKGFLSLNEEGKTSNNQSYTAKQCWLLQYLNLFWNINTDFKGFYREDYKLLQNEQMGSRTAWVDKYTTTIYSRLPINIPRYEPQPLPDYVRWMKTCEFHYMSPQEFTLLGTGPWNEVPGLFIPNNILDLCYTLFPDPTPTIKKLIAILSWCTPKEADEYYDQCKRQVQHLLHDDMTFELWKEHPLFKKHKKEELKTKCHFLKIPVSAAVTKIQLVKLIAEKKGETRDVTKIKKYTGLLKSVPKTTTALNKLSSSKLREILNYHSLPVIGIKEKLILRVFFLANGHAAEAVCKEREQLLDLIRVSKLLMLAQKRLEIHEHHYTRRTHQRVKSTQFIPPPPHINLNNLTELFDTLNVLLTTQTSTPSATCSTVTVDNEDTEESTEELMQQVGAIVKVKWSKKDLEGSGWKPGWYVATVQGYDHENDLLDIVYRSEPEHSYTIQLNDFIVEKNIKLQTAAL